jgi:flavin-binding protein dodecin
VFSLPIASGRATNERVSKLALRKEVALRDMAVASVTELSAVHPDGFEQAIQEGINRANKTLRNVQGCWIKDMNVLIDDGNIRGYKVNMAITFVLEDGS